MTVARIEIHDQGVAELLELLVDAGENLEPWLAVIGRVLKSDIQLGFRTGTDPYGMPWAPLRSRSGQILVDRGHLMNSIDYAVEGNDVIVGTNKLYGGTHQFGAEIRPRSAKVLHFFVNGRPVFARKVTIPARPFLPWEGLPAPWASDLKSELNAYFEQLAA
jgi:phage virion morphogenesis protein